MKTLEWLQEAKNEGYDWADAALKNYDHAYASAQPDPDTLSQAIGFAFNWENVPERYDYWAGICKSVAPVPTLSDIVDRFTELKATVDTPEDFSDLREPYRSTVIEAIKASRKEELEEVKGRILEVLGIEATKQLVGWVVRTYEGNIVRYKAPDKTDRGWTAVTTRFITDEEAVELCGRVPEWSDEEPTPIYK